MAREGGPGGSGREPHSADAPEGSSRWRAPSPGHGDGDSLASTFLLLGRLAGVGWFVGISIAGGAVGGYYLDRWLDTSPWLTLTGVTLGGAVATTGTVRLLKSIAGTRKPERR